MTSSLRSLHPLRSIVAVLVVGSGLILSTAASATADDAAIAHVETTSSGLRALVSVPAGAKVDLGAVTATVDGTSAPATARRSGQTSEVRRTAVLAMDTSESMKGDRFSSAQQAALEFIDSVPDDVYVGIVAFAGEVSEPLPPTLDRQAARRVVGDLELTHGTRLYDGVSTAVTASGTEGQRTIVVLSDGADTSDTPLDDTASLVSDADVLLDVVALGQSEDSLAALTELADAGHGQVIEAERAALARAFSEEAQALARQVLVTVEVPPGKNTEGTLAISLPTSTGTLTTEAFTTVRDDTESADALVPQEVDPGFSAPGWVMYAGVVALGIGLFAVAMLLVPRPAGATPRSMVDRVTQYTSHQSHRPSGPQEQKSDGHGMGAATTAVTGLLERNRGFEERVFQRLEGAGSELKPAEWLIVHLAVFVGAGLLGVLIGKGNIVIGILFLALGAWLPWMYLGRRKARRRKAFNAALPEVLQLMSGSLAAGLSLAQSLDTIVREGVEPIAGDFRRVLMEARLGVPLEDALDGVAERFESRDFEWAVMAIRIQRQVGGNLAELLATVAATMREREYIRRQVAALAAEGKLSAIVLGALPPLFLLYLLLTQRDFVMPLFTDPRGWVMLGFGTVWLGVGIFWMSRLIKVEV